MGEEELVVNLRRDVKVVLRMVIMTLTSTTICIMTLIIIVFFFSSTRFVPDHLDDDIDDSFLPGVRDM